MMMKVIFQFFLFSILAEKKGGKIQLSLKFSMMGDTKNWNQMTKMAGSLQPFFLELQLSANLPIV